MPKYTNNTSGPITYETTSGAWMQAKPGQTFETYRWINITDVVKVADAPLWTPYLAGPKTITAAGAETKAQSIAAATERLRIISLDDGITASVRIHTASVFVAAHEMVPALAADDCPLDIMTEGKVSDIHLVFSGAGSAVIAEMAQ
jgi:hypothetical protein